MTTELVLLIAIYAFLLVGVFLGDSGPISVFKDSAPKLAAKIERNISVGREFRKQGGPNEWHAPADSGDAP